MTRRTKPFRVLTAVLLTTLPINMFLIYQEDRKGFADCARQGEVRQHDFSEQLHFNDPASWCLKPEFEIKIFQSEKQEIVQNIGKIQIPFIANEGQTDEQVAFYTGYSGGKVFVTKDGEIVYLFNHDPQLAGIVLKEKLIGKKISSVKGEQEAITKVCYLKGQDVSGWRSGISVFDSVNLGEVYEGVELKLMVRGNTIEKCFFIGPGGDPGTIQQSLDGVYALKVNEKGQLEAKTTQGFVSFTKPVAYQEIDGKRVEVGCKYVVREPSFLKEVTQEANKHDGDGYHFTYGFCVSSYDKTRELVIDPLLASTYLGGSAADYISSIAIDTEGNIYAAGGTLSSDFPATAGAYDTHFNKRYDAFIVKTNSDLTELLGATYLGGSFDDYGYPVAIDTDGNIYVAGTTRSTDFPVTAGAYQTSINGYVDTFIAKLNSDLTKLLASTFLGGAYYDYGNALAIDADKNIYVGGYTDSSDFPTSPDAYDTAFKNSYAVFLSKLDNNLTGLQASTYLGGSSDDRAYSIALDRWGNVYITGKTSSSDFPTTARVYDNSYNGFGGDAFVSRLNGNLTRLLSSTYLGGSSGDEGTSLAIDIRGNVYVTGKTASFDFPTTPNAYSTSFRGGSSDAFVSLLEGSLANLISSTFLGGSSGENGSFIALDSEGSVYVTGNTSSSDFPTTPGAFDNSYNNGGDVFISRFDVGLSRLLSSTYLGGSAGEEGSSLAIDFSGNIYVAGKTTSSDFPVIQGAYDTLYGGFGGDAFLSRFNMKESVNK
ncbi:MAG: SBBP repeat-containing protein [Candidatus Loosdrechtia sp.]|uniref:SBBP repeat-containing protein n=1 Tax=Candidatus Loosdrechtia sp. TaxID=3101272 RepID=UPI003A712EA1|nr:MAG: SBBP repeat-containing protein [Candidatus Jettenia sp. AMX2]